MGSFEGEECMKLPPGFRFHPTDEEIITHYLLPKLVDHGFSARAIGEVDLNKCEPWDMPSKAKMGEKEWYFFCQRDRKYPTGMRTNRATEAGYWKATGKDKEIFRGRGVLVGMKKTLVFYRGRAPKGEKTNWVMHEYRPEAKAIFPNLPMNAKDEWVVCRVFHKSNGSAKKSLPMTAMLGATRMEMSSFVMEEEEDEEEEDLLQESAGMPPPPLIDPSKTTNQYNSGGPMTMRKAPAAMSTMSMPPSGIAAAFFSNLLDFDETNFHGNAMKAGDFAAAFDNFSVGNELQSSSSAMAAFRYPEFPASTSAFGYLPPDHAIMAGGGVSGGGNGIQPAMPLMAAMCKAEQVSNQSMISQDTGGEISSALSTKHGYDELDDPTSAAAFGPALNLRYMWNKY